MTQDYNIYKNKWIALLLLLPTILILLLFLYYPILETFLLSLYRVGFLGLTKKFVGLDNYKYIFSSKDYIKIFKNTAVFIVPSILLSITIGFIISLFLNSKIKGISFFRLLLIWPYALPPAVAGVIFLFLFNEQSGITNFLLNKVLQIQIPWLSNNILAMGVLIIAFVWKMLGYNIVFYLAALQNIPEELLEAASLEGASYFQKIFKIILPLLSPISLFLLITNTIAAFFESFAFVDLITKGGPAGSTTILIYSIYRDGFEYFKTGIAAAQSVILFIFVVILTLIQLRVSSRMVHYER
ncbi:binding-protein-dependent transport systems inner membrane component [Thermodesulfatator indicus DSM 15286]|uniref:Binding-protein-dependent transport systems inner membrane component n=1 Tax=Thermodesulfatator indicus (strain DSM 15286 / JCM 11887 / CIR29812) TaxID=667014 RepID=F8ABU6_THEID|nr:sugar ABC transporter permease [Thermodesulfatator indicus]AEH44556.1 binding-protein-dependent transport systems inner membrane component [Thermodesulfatator indicus DSM 15286]